MEGRGLCKRQGVGGPERGVTCIVMCGRGSGGRGLCGSLGSGAVLVRGVA